MGWVLDRNAIVEGSRIAYRDGGGKGRPVVLVHGTPSHSYIWRRVVPGLAAAGYRVLAFDLLGYGHSERPLQKDTSVASQARLLDGLLDIWRLDRADVIGHDIGGAAAMILAVRKPERFRSLAVIDTPSYDSWPSETWRKIIREHLHEYHRMSLEEFRTTMVRQLEMTVHHKARMSGETLDAYLRPLLGELGKTSFFVHQVSHYDSRYTEEIAGDLTKLSMPVKILWGEQDEWQPVSYAKRLAQDIPRAMLTVIPEAGHFLMEDEPDRVTEELLGFLQKS
jgi:pimeloyl-ACP methyl ester carboxylesterase